MSLRHVYDLANSGLYRCDRGLYLQHHHLGRCLQGRDLEGFGIPALRLYFLYYALFEFEHENKWLIVLGSLGGSAIASGLFMMSGFQAR
ncbi:MAG: hypothetical protein QOJ65_1005 [Fimbriimonadaceae bacterium]|jgi:hypothetical protein|nr:hypothetical protein [Fimbriimonadaceae bacterium]